VFATIAPLAMPGSPSYPVGADVDAARGTGSGRDGLRDGRAGQSFHNEYRSLPVLLIIASQIGISSVRRLRSAALSRACAAL
jgi:hypothetical protein